MQLHRLKELREAIAAVEAGSRRTGSRRTRSSRSLLLSPGVHEWFLDGLGEPSRWMPPFGVLLHLVREFLSSSAGLAFWIGRRCWPHFEVLGGALLRRCVFVDPPGEDNRLWAIDLAARCEGVVVVADGSGLDMAASRRLQLACEAGESLVLCARPAAELARLSAASARWLVRSAPSGDGSPRWTIELLRFKGNWKDAQRGVVVHAALVGGPGPALLAAGGCSA